MELRFWLKTHKANRLGLAPISLRITIAGQRAEVSTRLRIHPTAWRGHHELILEASKADRLNNEMLRNLESRARLVAQMLDFKAGEESITAEEVAQALRPAKAQPKPVVVAEPTLSERLATVLTTIYGPGNAGTYTSYASCLKVWRKWPASERLLLEGLTASVTRSFVTWLKQSYAPTSCATILSGLNALLKHAAPTHLVTFAGLANGGKSQRKDRQALKREQLDMLRQAQDLPASQALARAIFLTQYYLHGSRVGAVLELRKEQIDVRSGRVKFTTHKSLRYKDVALREALHELLLPYLHTPGPLLFPLLPANYFALDKDARFKQKDNARACLVGALHRLSKRLGLPLKLHSHMARHTLALHAYEKTKDLRVPQQMLGHASIAETAGYIASLSGSELDAASDDVYDNL